MEIERDSYGMTQLSILQVYIFQVLPSDFWQKWEIVTHWEHIRIPFSMSHRFTDIKVRDQYIIGLTEVIAEIFGIAEKPQKCALYNELYGLDDEALINKQKYVEEYLDRDNQLLLAFQSQVKKFEHMMDEIQERATLQSNPAFSL